MSIFGAFSDPKFPRSGLNKEIYSENLHIQMHFTQWECILYIIANAYLTQHFITSTPMLLTLLGDCIEDRAFYTCLG